MISKVKYIYTQQQQSLPISLLKKVRGLCFVFVLLAVSANFSANTVQAQDTIATQKKTVPADPKLEHSPRKALIFSLILPGSGQAYNQKYWKMPIVYAGFGTMIYFIQYNTKIYKELSAAYEWTAVTSQTSYPPTPVNIFYPVPPPPNEWATMGYSADQLKQGRDTYRRNVEVSYILTGVLYILTTVDAVVDAHFFDYNINNDLTLRIDPWMPPMGLNSSTGIAAGINLSVRFK